MITLRKLKKHFFFMLILSGMFFAAAFFISFGIKKYNEPNPVTKRLNTEINFALSDLDREIDKIAVKNLNEKAEVLVFLTNTYKNTFAKKGIEILVFNKDSLVFWSDCVFASPNSNESEYFTSGIIRNGSGFYLVKQRMVRGFKIVVLQLVKYSYRYTNEYLPTGFVRKFNAPHNAEIDLTPGKYNVTDRSGKFLFSLNYQQPFELPLWLQYLILTLYITSFLLFIAASIVMYMFLMRDFGQKWFTFLVFAFDIIILRAIQFYFRFPEDLYQSQLFNPAYFASSVYLPSLGDFLINAILGLQLMYFAYKRYPYWHKKQQINIFNQNTLAILSLYFLILIFYLLTLSIKGLVLNSVISFRFENILSLPLISHVGVLILSILLFCFLLFFEILSKNIKKYVGNFYSIFLAGGIFLFAGFSYLFGTFDVISIGFLLCLLLVLFFQIRFKSFEENKFNRYIIIITIFASLATYLLNQAESKREHESRKLFATHLSDARDNMAEYYFSEAVKSIREDPKLKEILISESSNIDAAAYIKENFFSGYWNKYLIQVTICQENKTLSIKPGNILTSCEAYFEEKISQYMQPVSKNGLYFLRRSVDAMYYLGKIEIEIEKATGLTNSTKQYIYVEISSNNMRMGLSYPELLVDQKNTNNLNLSNYSYAFYKRGELVKNVGKFTYDIENQNIKFQENKNGFFDLKGYNHFVYNSDKDTMVILSKENARISDLISPFSYIFLLLLIMLLLLTGNISFFQNWNINIHTFRFRLQVIMITVIVISSVILVTVSLLFINMLNRNKNNEILSEKLNSVLVDLEGKYSMISSLDEIPREELSDIVINQSNTYFTDINIYNRRGFLLASSRDQIFREGMISEQLSPSSATKLMIDKKSVFIERESIGSYTFLSAYTPVRNVDNQLIGYLNLPYFAKQEEIRREISSLISAFANIYIIMIVITLMLALVLSKYITRPLQHIGNQFSTVKIGNNNAKIEWTRKDEIGRLVFEYNRMIDEMERSAELLARSERESAWRQMARQVAHEIKNPLTPIKLSMQLLMRAWNDKAPDWDDRLKRFSQTLIMQIDTLSSIATEFSDFAQMPEPQIQQFDLIPLVQQSASLFRDQSDCKIDFNTELQQCIIKADPNQILRVFNNLIKNALQAIPANKQGQIQISLKTSDNTCIISFQDNGTGIPNDRQTRIFSPNFTTKTAGMGLGLAMVKNIIDSSSGHIWFDTEPGEGTTFFVSLPLKDKQ